MDSEALKLKIDSSQARNDLDALAKSLDRASKAAGSMQSNLAKGVDKSNEALTRGAKNIERFARVTGELSKIKLSGDPAKQLTEFANAVAAVARAKEISATKLTALSKFVQVGAQVSKLNFTAASFAGLNAFTQAVDSAARSRTISAQKLKSWVDFIEVGARSSKLRISPQTAQSLKLFGDAMSSVASARGLSAAKLGMIRELFSTLATAKPVPNAASIARDLDQIAAAAGRAAKSLAEVKGMRAGSGGKATKLAASGIGAGAATSSAQKFNTEVGKTTDVTSKASKGVLSLGTSLDGLTSRFKLSYQAGTLFSAMFSAFTFGQLVKGVYDTTVSFQKLNKAMLFVTGTYDGAHKATQDFIDISNGLGASIEKNADAYSRFAISSGAAGLKLGEVNKIYTATQLALTAVGANTEQVGYAFYGLSQAMAKGKISSEEFNRQIGEQIPGNAQAGAKALTKLTGQRKDVADLFDEMRKGTLTSVPFLKAWAEELEHMYRPLLPEAEKRPDFQLNRLNNAFTLWKREVGESQFIGALTTQFKRLADMLVTTQNGQTKLTASGQKLADSFGKGLASGVNLIGDALAWLADNIEGVVAALKGLAVLGIGQELSKWARQAAKFGDEMLKVKGAAEATAATEKRVAATKAAATGQASLSGGRMDMATNRQRGSAMGGTFVGTSSAPRSRETANFSQLGYLTGDRTSTVRGNAPFGRASNRFGGAALGGAGRAFDRSAFPAARGGANQSMLSRFAGTGSALASGASMAAGAAASGAVKAFGGLRFALNALPGVALAATVALALFGNNVTKLGEKTVTYNGIISSALQSIGSTIGGGVTDLLNQLAGLGKAAKGDGGKSTGDWLVDLSVALITFGKVVFTLASSLGKVIGTLLADVIVPWVEIAAKLANKDYKGAGETYLKNLNPLNKDRRDRFSTLGDTLKTDWASALDTKGLREQIVKGTKDANADKTAADAANAANKTTEAALAQMKAADMQAAAAADLKDATANFKKDVEPLDYATLRKELVGLSDGSYAKTLKTPGAMSGGSVDTASAVQAYAAGMSSKVYDTAASFKGQTENKNAGSLQAYFKANGVTIDPKKLSWCAAFVNAVLSQNGMAGSGSLAASSFKDYGTEVSKKDAQKGDIVVLKPQAAGATGHVGFLDGFDRHGNPRVLGGNQGTEGGGGVKVSTFAADQVVSFRKAGSGGPAGVAASGLGGGVKDGDGEEGGKLFERRANSWKSLQPLLGAGGPGQDAIADYQSNLEKLRDVIKQEKALGEQVGGAFKSFIDAKVIEDLDRSQAHWVQTITDAINPLGKETRLLTQTNDVLALRAKGLNDAADWQERLNGLSEQGVDISKMKDEATWTKYLIDLKAVNKDLDIEALKMKPEELKAQQGRNAALAAEIDLTKALNDARVASIARTGSSYDRTFSSLVSGKGKEGETYDQIVARLQGETDSKSGRSTYEILQEQAGTMEGSRVADSKAAMASQAKQLRETSRLNSSDRSYYEDYQSALGDLTGQSGKSLSELLEGADEESKALAKNFADAKAELENPPGFQKWADALEPLNRRLQDIKANFAETLSDSLTDALMGEKVDWSKIAKDFTRQLVKARVDTAVQKLIYRTTGAPGAVQQPETAGGGGIWNGIKSFFGFGGSAPGATASTAASGVPGLSGATGTGAAAATATQSMVVNAGTVTINGSALGGGAAGIAGAPANDNVATAATSAISAIASAVTGGGPTGDANSAVSIQGALEAFKPDQTGGPGFMPAGSGLPSSIGGGKGGIMGGLSSLFGGAKGGLNNILGGGSGSMATAAQGQVGPIMAAVGGVNAIMDIFGLGKKPKKEKSYHMPGGIIGEMSNQTMSGTAIGAKENPFATAINLGLNLATGGAYGQYKGIGDAIGSTVGRFKEGGYTGSPVSISSVASMGAWAGAPHYKEGTPNTSLADGGMPAIVHPDEAVIPLSRGRSIPVDMSGMDSGGPRQTIVNSTFNIMTPDIGGFRASQQSIARKQNRTLKRSSLRNAA